MPGPRQPPTWREIALLLAALAIGLLLVEAALRLHYAWHRRGSLADIVATPPPPAGERVRLRQILRISPHRDQLYELIPGLDVRFVGARTVTGSHGWREEERPLAKPPGTRRIVGLGDSVMFGWGVAVEERYLDLLETALATRHPGIDWQTWALAVPGYDLAMSLAALDRFGNALDPDLLVYGWMPNDQCLPNFVVPEPDPWTATSFIALYLDGEAGLPRLTPRHRAVREAQDAADDGADGARATLDERFCFPEDVPEAFRHRVGPRPFVANLERLAAFGRRHDVPVVVLKYNADHYHALPDPLPDGLTLIDLQPLHDRAFLAGPRPGPASDLYLSPRDRHPSPKAHRLLARGLLRELERRGLVARLASTATSDG